MIKAVRGTRDLLPPQTALWNFVEATVRDVFRAYNFHEIRTPIFEETQLFARSVGEETDIVAKEMFTWEDRARAGSQQLSEWLENIQESLGGSPTETLNYISSSKAQIEGKNGRRSLLLSAPKTLPASSGHTSSTIWKSAA